MHTTVHLFWQLSSPTTLPFNAIYYMQLLSVKMFQYFTGKMEGRSNTTNCVLTVGTPPFSQLFIGIVLEVNTAMFLIIKQCAAVSACSADFERLHRQFYTRFYVQQNWILYRNLAPRAIYHQLKTQTSVRFRRFHSYSFTLWANVRITSKTYFLVSFWEFLWE